MTDFNRIPIHQVQEFRHESHGDFQSDSGVRSGRDADPEMFAAMDKFIEELINAGIMLDGTGLKPSSRGARVRFSGSNRTVTDGPFPETKEVIAGFMIWKVSSLQEAIDWVKKCPNMIDRKTPTSKFVRSWNRRTLPGWSRPSGWRK